MKASKWCPRCGKSLEEAGCWCGPCHLAVMEEIRARERLPVGRPQDAERFPPPRDPVFPCRKKKSEVARCSECGRVLEVRGHILGKPYCADCLEPRPVPCRPATREDDGGPWQQTAVRFLEDALSTLE